MADEEKSKLRNYDRKVLYRCSAFEVVCCEWKIGSNSPMHHHGESDCYVLVEEGLFEESVQSGLERSTFLRRSGEVIHTPSFASHDLLCKSDYARTVHVYVPPLSAQTAGDSFSSADPSKFADFDFPLSRAGVSRDAFASVLKQVREKSVSVHSAYFMNQLFSGILPEAVAASEVVAATKATLATQEASPVFTRAEREVVFALSRELGWDPKKSGGLAVPGGSAANFMGLHCARQRAFPASRDEGNLGHRFRVFVSEESHYSWKKGCMALGFGLNAVVPIRADGDGRLIPEHLKEEISKSRSRGEVPLLAGATAGTTVKGAFDPIRAMHEVCLDQKVWLHVDAAWGGPAVFSSSAKPLMDGVELADSLTFDAHKLLGASLTSSVFVTRHDEILREANDVAATYLFHDDEGGGDRGRLSWQCGRPADAFGFWSIWKRYGSDGFAALVDRQLALRGDFVRLLAESGPRIKLLHDPQFLNVCVQVLPPSGSQDAAGWSRHVRQSLLESDRAMINFSVDSHGVSFLRFILVHPALELSHLRRVIQWALEVR
jgi:glutamate/tyrosine decarboxylase-like PLP-dependent enzyme